MAKFSVNGEKQLLDVEADMPRLWVSRNELGLTGTKFGCRVASFGACKVHVNGVALRSCVTPISAVEKQEETTIEVLTDIGQATSKTAPSPLTVQQAWIDHQVPQYGYCQSVI